MDYIKAEFKILKLKLTIKISSQKASKIRT